MKKNMVNRVSKDTSAQKTRTKKSVKSVKSELSDLKKSTILKPKNKLTKAQRKKYLKLIAPKPSSGFSEAILWEPEGYQLDTVHFMVANSVAGVFADPGLGKTSMTLAAISILLDSGEIDKVFIIAPKLVCYYVWPFEIVKWLNFNHLTHTVLHGDSKDENLKEDVDIYLINPHGLEWLHDNWPKKFDNYNILLTVDESTIFKAHDSMRFKILRGGEVKRKRDKKKFKALLSKFYRRVILTGTPTPHSLLDLFAQIYILDFGKALGRYITHFRTRWFNPTGFGGYEWVLRDKDAGKEIEEAIAPMIVRLDANDYIELPPLIGDITGISGEMCKTGVGLVNLEMPDKVRSIYDELEEEFIIQLENDTVTAAQASTVSMKLEQIANGGIYIGKGKDRKTKNIHNIKAERTLEIVEQLSGQPTLITYQFNHDLDRLLKVFGKKTPYIGKGVSKKVTDKIVKEWDNHMLPVVLVQPQSVSHGLNMQGAGKAVIWHSLIWNYEFYLQLVRRIWRRGQEDKVFLYHLAFRNSIDHVKIQSLISKNATEKSFLSAMRDYYLKGKRTPM